MNKTFKQMLQMGMFSDPNIVRNGLITWLQIDANTGFFKAETGPEATNYGLIYNDGWLKGNGISTYATISQISPAPTATTIAVYLNPTLSAKHQGTVDSYQSVFQFGTLSAGIVFRTGSIGALSYFIRGEVNYAGPGFVNRLYYPAVRYTTPVLIHLTITPTKMCIYDNSTKVDDYDISGASGTINGYSDPYWILARNAPDQYSEMGVRDILLYNRALSDGEVAINVSKLHI
jgi:hypothetical protein